MTIESHVLGIQRVCPALKDSGSEHLVIAIELRDDKTVLPPSLWAEGGTRYRQDQMFASQEYFGVQDVQVLDTEGRRPEYPRAFSPKVVID